MTIDRKIDILIPTLKPAEEMRTEIRQIMMTAVLPHRLIASCQPISAAKNRNLCLAWCRTDVAIMVDDDIEGFYQGWDRDLIAPLLEIPSAVAVSARLLNPDGSFGPTCSDNFCFDAEYVEVLPAESCVMPTAAIAFRRMNTPVRNTDFDLWFDEHFLGSGFEDGDWFFQYLNLARGYTFWTHNGCRLIHHNEMKEQGVTILPDGSEQHEKDGNYFKNYAYFKSKWKDCGQQFNCRGQRPPVQWRPGSGPIRSLAN